MGKTDISTDRKILNILIPVILENALMTCSTMILTAYIGRLSVFEINAYGITRRIYGIYYSVFKGLSVGTMIAVAKRYGQGDIKKCARLQQESYFLFVPLAMLSAFLIFLYARVLLGSMTGEAGLLDTGTELLKNMVFFFPLLAVIHLNAAAFQANGNTRTPMVIAALGNLVNIVFGYMLIFGFRFIPALGINGAVISQNLSFIVMALAGAFLLYGKNGPFAQYEKNLLKLPLKEDVREMLSSGIPAALEDSFWQLANIVISAVILSYGQDYYAAYQVGLEGEGFCNMMSAGFMTAAMSLSSNAIGAQDEKSYNLSFQRLCYFCGIITLITMLFLTFFTRATLSLMTDKPELIAIAAGYMHVMIWSQYPQHRQKIEIGFIRTAGHTRTTMFTNLIGLWAVRVPLVVLFGSVLHLNIYAVWWVFNIDQWIRLLLSFFFYRRYDIADTVQRKRNYSLQEGCI